MSLRFDDPHEMLDYRFTVKKKNRHQKLNRHQSFKHDIVENGKKNFHFTKEKLTF